MFERVGVVTPDNIVETMLKSEKGWSKIVAYVREVLLPKDKDKTIKTPPIPVEIPRGGQSEFSSIAWASSLLFYSLLAF